MIPLNKGPISSDIQSHLYASKAYYVGRCQNHLYVSKAYSKSPKHFRGNKHRNVNHENNNPKMNSMDET